MKEITGKKLFEKRRGTNKKKWGGGAGKNLYRRMEEEGRSYGGSER
jgi:hypothetical protein